MCAQLYVQKNAQPDTWVMSGAPTATTVFLSLAATINYSDGSPSDTLPANTLALLPDGTSVSFDRTADVYVPYVIKGDATLRIIKESLLPTLTSDYAALARVELHGIKPYQPEPYLAAGGLGTPPVTSTVAESDATSKVLALWNGSGNNAPPSGWQTPTFDDSAWGAAVSLGTASSPPALAGSSYIWSASSPASQTDACLFRKTVVLPAGGIGGATLSLNADDKLLAAYVNGTAPAGMAPWDNTGGSGGGLRTADVTALLLPGQANCIALEVQNNSALPSPNTASVNWALQVTQSAIGAPSDPTLHEGDLIYRHSGTLAALSIGPSGDVLTSTGTDPAWAAPATSGTVTSVQVAVPAPLSASGGPITGGGTITLAWASGQSANRVLASPNGTTGAVSLRALVAADIPSLPASQITSGQLAAARGGTGIDTSAVTDGQLLIGQSSDHSLGLAALTAGSGVTITNAGHSITVAASGGGGTPSFSWATKTSAYTLTSSDTGILADATSGAFTVTLPTAVGSTARYSIKKKDTSANAVTLATTSSQTIDGATTLALASPGSTLDLISDGSNWYGAGGPRGRIGYAQVTAGQGSISSTATDLTGLSVTVTVGARPLRLTAFCSDAYTTGAVGNRIWLNIYDTTAGAVLQQGVTDNVLSGGQDQSIACSVVVAPAAGSRSYKLQMHAEGSQTVTLSASSTNVAYLLVEEI